MGTIKEWKKKKKKKKEEEKFKILEKWVFWFLWGKTGNGGKWWPAVVRWVWILGSVWGRRTEKEGESTVQRYSEMGKMGEK
jgi:hypothetical protein